MSHPATPQVNATVTSVTDDTAATGGRDDWDSPGTEPSGAGASKWAGALAAYFTQDLERVAVPAGADLAKLRVLIVASSWVSDVGLDEGDVITLTHAGSTVSGRARLIEVRTLPGVDAALQTARLTLETT